MCPFLTFESCDLHEIKYETHVTGGQPKIINS